MHMHLRLLTGQLWEMASLQNVLENAPTYVQRLTGRPPTDTQAQRLVEALPAGATSDNKYLYGVMGSELNMIGCAEIIRGWPTPSTALIGLLLLDETHQGHGHGRSAYRLVEEKVRSWPEIDTLRIAVVRSNADVLPFWRRMGFTEASAVQLSRPDAPGSEPLIFVKPLPDEDSTRRPRTGSGFLGWFGRG